MRYDSPLQLFERTATEDVEIGGVTVERGQKIAALLGAANRDPAVFDAPDTFDVGRTDNGHITFGAGIHFCIGAPLARLEIAVSLDQLRDAYANSDWAQENVLIAVAGGRKAVDFVMGDIAVGPYAHVADETEPGSGAGAAVGS